jgi:hypothetical protein
MHSKANAIWTNFSEGEAGKGKSGTGKSINLLKKINNQRLLVFSYLSAI